MKTKPRRLNELSRDELKSMFVSMISGHDKEVELAHMLAVFAAIKLPLASAIKYEVTEYDTSELITLIENGVLCNNGGGYDEEDFAWSLIFASLKPDEIMNIILDINDYTIHLHKAIQPFKEQLLNAMISFVESED